MLLIEFSTRKPKPVKKVNREENKGVSHYDTETTEFHDNHLSQQGVPLNQTMANNEFDDWEIISTPNQHFRITHITVYADYFICAMEITFEDFSGHCIKQIHSTDESYKEREDEIHKAELEIDPDDYIEFVSCAYSSQKPAIRNIKIGTHKRK